MTTTFAVMYSYTDDTELREATRPAHREYLNGFTADGADQHVPFLGEEIHEVRLVR